MPLLSRSESSSSVPGSSITTSGTSGTNTRSTYPSHHSERHRCKNLTAIPLPPRRSQEGDQQVPQCLGMLGPRGAREPGCLGVHSSPPESPNPTHGELLREELVGCLCVRHPEAPQIGGGAADEQAVLLMGITNIISIMDADQLVCYWL